MVLREQNDPLNHSRGIMGPLESAGGVQNNRGRLRQRFDLIRKLGQGTYGKVQLGIDKETGQEVAIKTIKKSKIETEADLIRIQREIQIMSSVRHPNIIHIYEVFENREKMVLVMEYAAGGELYDYLNERKTLKEDEARRIFRQISSAVYYCHKHNICHRDLKLENILLDEKSNAKIADFGLSNVFDDIHLLKTFCGSPLYASPEIVRGTPYYGPEVDCWSLGVLLYTLVYGAMPFDGSNFKRLVKQISNGDYYEPSKKAEASGLIRLMLTVDPLKRASIKDVCSHDWINQGFSDSCFKIAEELANQTPVRLDLLLSLAPGATVNPTLATNDKQPMEVSSSSMKPEKLKSKSKRDAETPDRCPTKEKEPKVVKTPNDVKRKQSVKKKSKSSPLLELIVDVEEEKEQEMDEDVGDTLSEISEIQTIAEEIPKDKEKEQPPKSTASTSNNLKSTEKKEKPATTVSKQVANAEPKPKVNEVEKVVVNGPAVVKKESKDVAQVRVKENISVAPSQDKPAETKPPKKEEKVETAGEEIPSKPQEPEIKVKNKVEEKPINKEQQKPEPAAASSAAPTKVVKKKVVKPKVVEKENKVESNKPEAGESKATTTAANNEVVKEQEKVNSSGESSDNNSKQKSLPAAPKVKQRSDSVTGESTSPTRIERRNSKVISQKTAELIQNLEAKTSSTDAGAKGKKLVFPSLKVSDAKNRFEVTATEPNTSVVKPPSKTPASVPATMADNVPKPSPAIPSEKMVEKELPKKKLENVETVSAVKTQVVKPKVETQQREQPVQNNVPTPEATKETATISLPVKAKSKSRSPIDVPKKTEEETKPKAPEVKETPPKKAPAEKPNLKVKIIPIQPEAEAEQKIPTQKPVATSAPVQKPAVQTTPATARPQPQQPDSTATTPVLPKISPQNKEQAAKKIGSVIQRIVSSESVEKGMNEKGYGVSTPSTPAESRQGGGFKTEIQKFVAAANTGDSGRVQQRSEVRFPVAAAGSQERIIPIQLTDEVSNPGTANSSRNNSGASISARLPPRIDSMKSTTSSAFSRQNSSDTESSLATAPSHPHRMEALKKSPREFIIPIKVEASGHTVTPKEELLNSESSLTEDNFRFDSRLRPGRFANLKRFNSILSDSSLEDEPISASSSRRSSANTTSALPSHARSLSQGDEPSTSGTFKHYRRLKSGGLPLDKSDSFSSAEEDDEDTFEVLTAESLFTSLLDRVRNLTKRLNHESGIGQNWGEGMWGGHESPLHEFMSRAPSEARSFISSTTPGGGSVSRTYSREPSVTVTITSGGGAGGPSWRRSLSRDVSGESDSVLSEAVSRSSSQNARNFSPRSSGVFDSLSTRTVPTMRRPSPLAYTSQRSAPSSETSGIGIENSFKPAPVRPGYRRTLSNADYNNVSVTLPFRRPIRAYDRTLSSADYSTNNPYMSNTSNQNSLPSSNNSSVSSYSSRLMDPSTRFEPGSPYLTRYRTLNRYSSTPEPDSRKFGANINNGSESPLLGRTNTPGNCEGWVGGSNSSSTRTTAAKMTTQEKMDSYQNYYQSLAQNPLRRLNSENPTPTNFVPPPTNSVSYNSNTTNSETSTTPTPDIKDSESILNNNAYDKTQFSNNINGINSNQVGVQVPKQSESGPTKVVNPAHKWPTVSVKQHRPVSISNFPDRPCPPEMNSAPVVDSSGNCMNSFRPLSPAAVAKGSFVKTQAERLTSPPPERNNGSNYDGRSMSVQPKLKPDHTRATSVDKITRFLEKKAAPKEIGQDKRQVKSPTPISSPTPERESFSPEKTIKAVSGSKITKPKFFQSLEKKFEKFTNKRDDPPPSNSSCSTPDPQVNTAQMPDDENVIDPGNESLLLQRAVSPEKKTKSKFGASTVNFMLGKFRRIEESSSSSPNSKPLLATKPPAGRVGGGGRRVQSVYAGACSDGVLTLPFPQRNNTESDRQKLSISFSPNNNVSSNTSNCTTGDEVLKISEPQQLDSMNLNNIKNDDIKERESCNSKSTKPKRPVSLGIFSKNNVEQSKSSSFIPRSCNNNTQPTPTTSFAPTSINNNQSSSTTPAAKEDKKDFAASPLPSSPPTATAPPTTSTSMLQINVDYVGSPKDENVLTPNSISDNSSLCSEKTEVSTKSSILDEEESVSDRILRKSFYSRFNSLDHKTPNSISPNTYSASGIKRYSPNRSSTSKLSLDCSKYNSSSSCLPSSSSSLSPKINKYNPNPLFRELITDDYKSNVDRKTEYSRRVTSKLSKLLRDIESDINLCNGLTTATTSNSSESTETNKNQNGSLVNNNNNNNNGEIGSSSGGAMVNGGRHQD